MEILTNQSKNKIPFSMPWLGPEEKQMILDVMNGDLSSGGMFSSRCAEKISEFLQNPYVLLTTSCTHSIELALMVLGVKPGDEVLIPSFTFVSTANAVISQGGKPVFVEIDESTFNMDYEDIKRKLTPATAGIIPVHYAGMSCEMHEIKEIAAESNVWIVEDAAQAFGAYYKGKALGTLGSFGCFSFHHTKNIVCGEGGALVTNDKELFSKAEICQEKGTNRNAFMRNEIDKYTWIRHGSSYVLAEPLAALLFTQIIRFEQIHENRKRVYMRYRESFAPLVSEGKIRLQKIPEYCEPNWHIFCFCVADEKERTRLLSHMRARSIEATFHYVPLHTSPYAHHNLGTREGNLPVTEKVAQTLVRLPLFPTMSEQQIERVITAVKEFFH